MADEKDRDTITVMMSRELAGLVRAIAAHRQITMAEVLDRYAMPGIRREQKAVIDEMQRAFEESDPVFANELGGES